MRKITAATFVSLDGIMQAPGGPDEDPTSDFKYGGWVFPYFDEASGEAMDEIFAKPYDLLLGRKTYDIFAAYWPNVTDPNDPVAAGFNKVTKYVASRSERDLAWNNSRWLGEDAVAALKKLKAGDGPDILVQGSSDFLQTLWEKELIDEFTVLTFPVLLGQGKRLFGDTVAPVGLKLLASKAYPTGVVVSKYVPDGAVRTGSFAQQEPSAAELERRKNLA